MQFQQSTREHAGPQQKNRQYARPASQHDAWAPHPRLGRLSLSEPGTTSQAAKSHLEGTLASLRALVKYEIRGEGLAGPPCSPLLSLRLQVRAFPSLSSKGKSKKLQSVQGWESDFNTGHWLSLGKPLSYVPLSIQESPARTGVRLQLLASMSNYYCLPACHL